MTNKTLLTFPCDFPIKIMGKTCDDFESEILKIIRKHVPDLPQNAIKINHSANRNYASITVTVNAQSQQQLDDIYRGLSASDKVIMAL